jgi:hypothetical protein
MAAFETELNTFQKNLPSLLAHDGKFVVICGEEVLGTFDTYSDALSAGYAKYGATKPFLVQKIAPAQTVAFTTRAIVACPA